VKITRKLAAIAGTAVAGLAVLGAVLSGGQAGANMIGTRAAQTAGAYYPQGTTVDLCIGGNDHVYGEAGRDAGRLGSCAAGYVQLPVVSDPAGYLIPASASTAADTVTVAQPKNQDNTDTGTATLQLSASSSDGYAITSWTVSVSPDTPAFLTINSSGLITASLGSATPQTYVVTVTATDSVGTVGTATFDWVIGS
jgi:hypothetical protein